jgi:hypothetical protein
VSVTAIIYCPVADVAKAIEGLHANTALLEEITEDTKGAGITHHRFVAGTAELVVIDEGQSAEQFQGFFESNPKVERVTSVIGVSGLPAVTVHNSFEARSHLKPRCSPRLRDQFPRPPDAVAPTTRTRG